MPKGWEWARLGDVTNYGISYKASPEEVDDDMWILELEDVEKETSKLLQKVRYADRQFKSTKNFFSKGDVIYGKLRPYLDKVIVSDERGVCTTEMIPLRGYKNISSYFLKLVMKSPYFIRYANESTHGMNLPRLGTDKARLALFPIVSEPEQHRIVAKVDELMALCDQLEQEQADSNQTHQALVETLPASLENASNHEEFFKAWKHIATHFDILFTTEQSIDQLKQTILQLAVMGKLVPQDPTDEPASVLLEKIAKEKERLIKEGKIKKQKPIPKIPEEEKPFELPIGWEWVRFADIVRFKSKLVKPADFPEIDQVGPDSIEKGTGKLLFRRTVRESGVRSPNNRFYSGQILYSKIRPSLSKAIIAPFDGLCSADMYPLESMVNSEFLLKGILSEVFLEQVRIVENRIKMPKINVLSLSNIMLPLPPLSEQHRIVAKVDELMTLCDALKDRLNNAQNTQIQLADAISEKALNFA